MSSITIHPDNHIHDGLKPVFESLLRLANENKIMLLCEGNLFTDKSESMRQIQCHGIKWEGMNQNINGLESAINIEHVTWAMAARFAIDSGVSLDTQLMSAPKAGANLMRSFRIFCASLAP